MSNFPDFPDYLGAMGVGDGKVVIPSPPITSGWNPLYRGVGDRTFRWGLVTGLEPNPDLGYQHVTPSHYRLEITPDLGWANKEQMFEPYLDPTVGNARLHIFDFLVVHQELVDQGDESVTFTLTEAQMKEILAPGFENYLWRVMAVAPSGHEGHPSTIEPFVGRVWVPELAWAIDETEEFVDERTVVVKGDRSQRITSIEINGTTIWTTYPSPNRWEADIPLAPGTNMLFLRAYDDQGNGSAYHLVQVEMHSKSLKTDAYFNRFDDYGYKLGLKRLPSERNAAYKERLQDVFVHRAHPAYDGLMNAIGRELALDYEDAALLIAPALDDETGLARESVMVWLKARHFYVQREDYLKRLEHHVVEGRTWQVHPEKFLNGRLEVGLSPGTLISSDEYEVMNDVDGPYIQFHDAKYAGRTVYISYVYAERVSLEGKTVQGVVDELEAIQVNDKAVMTVTVLSTIASKSAEQLQAFPPIVLGAPNLYTDAAGTEYDDLPVRWTSWRLYALMDRDYKAKFQNEFGSQQGTKFAGWAYRLKNQLRTTWGYLRADHNVWTDPRLQVSGIGSIDHVYDAWRGDWMTSRGDGESYRLHPALAHLRGWLDPRDRSSLIFSGIPWKWFQSGYAWGHGLFTIVSQEAYEFETSGQEVQVVRQIVGDLDNTFGDLGVGTVDTSTEVS